MTIAHRLAVVTAAATLVLIVAGGLVTNTGSALAVPDWPTTFGHNMFLYPLSVMVGGVLYEHGHRLLGAAVGALTVLLAFVLESILIALAGGVLGILLALPVNGITTGTANFQTFSEVVFAFRISVPVMLRGLAFAALMGLFGGLLPAGRAARLPILQALREI